MSNKRKYIIIIFITIAVITLAAIIYLVSQKKPSNIEHPYGNDALVSTPISEPENYIEEVQPLGTKEITNYVAGGSDFYCPNNPRICEKIRTYYYNIDSKNYQSAYTYGNKIRSYENLVSTYSAYTHVYAGYIKEQVNGLFIAYITLVSPSNEIDYFSVSITANEDSILSSTPTGYGNKFDIDCGYIGMNKNQVCVFKLPSSDEIANLEADNFFYKPQFSRGKKMNNEETIYYSAGADVGSWAIIYKYNSKTKVLTYVNFIHFAIFPDVEHICSGDLKVDLSQGGCAEKYLDPEDVIKDREYLEAKEHYGLNI